MNRIGSIALENQNVAMAIISQSIIDEGAIGADGAITITYTSKNNAFYLWEIANKWNLVHPLRQKNYSNHTKWCISFKADKREEIYNSIGELPDPRQDKMFLHILRDGTGGINKGKKGETKGNIINALNKKNMTIRELSYDLDLSASTIRTHLRDLREKKKVCVIGCDHKCVNKNQRTSEIWSIIN